VWLTSIALLDKEGLIFLQMLCWLELILEKVLQEHTTVILTSLRKGETIFGSFYSLKSIDNAAEDCMLQDQNHILQQKVTKILPLYNWACTQTA
jgi:hypothetical protein